ASASNRSKRSLRGVSRTSNLPLQIPINRARKASVARTRDISVSQSGFLVPARKAPASWLYHTRRGFDKPGGRSHNSSLNQIVTYRRRPSAAARRFRFIRLYAKFDAVDEPGETIC